MPWNILQYIGQLHILLPSVAFVTHYTPLCWPGLFCRWYSYWKIPFNKSRQFFVCTIMALKLSLHSEPITSPTVKSSAPLESSSSLQLLWSEDVSSSSKRFQSHPQTGLPLCQYRTDCCFKLKENANAAVKKQSVIYEGDVVHHLKATDLSYVTITITFISCFISLLERHIKPSVQLETAKSKPRFREERKKRRNNF